MDVPVMLSEKRVKSKNLLAESRN